MALGNISLTITLDKQYKADLETARQDVQKFASYVSATLSRISGSGFTQLSQQVQEFSNSLKTLTVSAKEAGAATESTVQSFSQIRSTITSSLTGLVEFSTELRNVGSAEILASDETKILGSSLTTTAAEAEVASGALSGFREKLSQINLSNIAGNIKTQFEGLGANLEKSFGKIKEGIGGIAGGLTQLSVPAALGIGIAVKGFEDFQNSLISTQRYTGATDEVINKFGLSLEKLGKTTGTSLSELNKIAGIGAQLGVTQDQLLQFTEAINKVNVVVGGEFTGGVDQLTTTFQGLRNNLSDIKSQNAAEDITRLGSSILSLAATDIATAPGISDVANRIAGVGRTVGFTTPQLLGLATATQNLKISNEVAGTALSQVFTRMAKNVKEFAAVAGESTAEFKNKVNTNINQAFLDVLKGFKEGDPVTTTLIERLKTLGLNGQRIIEVFTKLSPATKDIVKDQEIAAKGLLDTSIVTDGYEKKQKSLTTTLGEVKNTLAELGNTLIQTLLPAIQPVLGKVAEVVSGITEGFGKLPQPVQTAIGSLLLFVAALLPISFVVGPLGAVIGGFVTVLSGLGIALAAIATPVGIVVAAIALLVGAFLALVTIKFDLITKVQQGIGPVLDFLKGIVAGVIAFGQQFVQHLKDAFNSKEVQTALDIFGKIFGGLIEAIGGLLKALAPIGAVIATVVGFILQFVTSTEFIKVVMITLSVVFGVVVAVITVIIKAFTNFITTITSVVGFVVFLISKIGEIPNIFNTVTKAIGDFFSSVGTAVNNFVQGIGSFFSGVGDNISKAFESAKDGVVRFFTDLFNNVKKTLIEFTDNVGKFKDGVIKTISEIPGKLAQAFTSFINDLPNNARKIGESIGEVIGRVIKFFRDLPGQVAEFVLALVTNITTKFNEIRDNATKAITELITNIVKFFTELPATIAKFVEELVTNTIKKLTEFKDNGIKLITELVTNVSKFFEELPGKVGKFVSDLVTTVVKFFTELTTNIIKIVGDTITNVVNFFSELPGKVGKFMGDLIATVGNFLGDLIRKGSDKGSEFVNTLIGFFTSLPGKIGDTFGAIIGKIGELFSQLIQKAINFGANFVNGIVDGLKSVGSKISDTVGGFFSGLGTGIRSGLGGKMDGGIMGYANGGIAGSTPSFGTDSIFSMLTPGEVVLPRGVSAQLVSLLKRIGNLPNMGQARIQPAIGGINMNIGSINAGSSDEARRRAGDLGFGLLNDLRSRGIN